MPKKEDEKKGSKETHISGDETKHSEPKTHRTSGAERVPAEGDPDFIGPVETPEHKRARENKEAEELERYEPGEETESTKASKEEADKRAGKEGEEVPPYLTTDAENARNAKGGQGAP